MCAMIFAMLVLRQQVVRFVRGPSLRILLLRYITLDYGGSSRLEIPTDEHIKGLRDSNMSGGTKQAEQHLGAKSYLQAMPF